MEAEGPAEGRREEGSAEEATEEAAPRETARTAARTALAWFVAVFYAVPAVNFALAPGSPALAGVLRVLGSVHVDAVPFYFMLQGYEACRRGPPEAGHRLAVLRDVLPQLVLSSLLYGVLQFFVDSRNGWDWANTALSPTMMSSLADVRRVNELRGVNEVSWIVQAQTLMAVFAPELRSHVERHLPSAHLFPWLLGGAWACGLLQLFFVPVELSNVASRSIFTNALFFTAGTLVCLSETDAPWRAVLTAPCRRLPGWVWPALGVAAGCVYVHHLDPAPERQPCVSVFGGTPCLWVFDACNSRLLPAHVLALTWLVDFSDDFPPWLGGALAEPLTTTLRHVNRGLASGAEFAPTWLLFGQFWAVALHKLLLFLAPGPCARFAYLLIPAEMALVTAGGVYFRLATRKPLAAAFDSVAARLGLL